MAGTTRNCCHLGAFCVHHTTVHHVTSCKATYVRCMRVLALTCYLRYWQNDRDLLRATAVTRGWNGYRNKSQHRKMILEKKILPPLQQEFEPATFRSRVRRSNHWTIPVVKGQNPYIRDTPHFIRMIESLQAPPNCTLVTHDCTSMCTNMEFSQRRASQGPGREGEKNKTACRCPGDWRLVPGLVCWSGSPNGRSSPKAFVPGLAAVVSFTSCEVYDLTTRVPPWGVLLSLWKLAIFCLL